MLNELVNAVASLGHWGYVVVFLVVMLECQVLLGLFMPGESLVMVSGFFAGQGAFNPVVLIVVVAGAAIVGDSIGYELGRYLGRSWLASRRSRRKRSGSWAGRLARVERMFVRHGGKAVFASHFLHVMRALMPFVAGASRMRYLRFLAFNSAGCAVWATLFVLLGYFLGANWTVAAHWVGRAGAVVMLAVLAVLAVGWFWRARRARESRWRDGGPTSCSRP